MVSIILPTYNGGKFIAKAIESVLHQSYTAWELLIISDGSTDDTKEIVTRFSLQDPRIIFLENERNLGIQKTLNKGIRQAKGKYIARLDDDDRWVHQEKLADQVSFLETHPDYVLVGTDAVIVDMDGAIVSKNMLPKTDDQIREMMLSKNCFSHATIVMRKDALLSTGGYSEEKNILHAEDYDLWLRLGTVGKMMNLSTQSTALIARQGSLTNKHRVTQARHILSFITRYRKSYPRFLRGYIISFARFLFFLVTSIIPFPKGFQYKIQQLYRSI